MTFNRLCRFHSNMLVALVYLVISNSTASAHSDVFLSNVGGQVGIGGANELGTVDEHFDLTTRVFEGVMISSFPPIGPADYGRDEPGFHALPGGSMAFPTGASALPGGAAVIVGLTDFQIAGSTAAAYYWDGIGEVDFVPLAAAQPNVDFTINPSPIGIVSGSGAADLHPTFKLNVNGPAVPGDGVYLIAPTVLVPSLQESEPFYMAFLIDALLEDEEAAEELEEAFELGQTVIHGKDFAFFEEAVEYVERLAVPEASSYVLAACAVLGLGGAWGRRRGILQ